MKRNLSSKSNVAIRTVAVAIIIVVVIAIAAVGAYIAMSSGGTTTSTTLHITTSTSSATSPTSSATSSINSSTSHSTSGASTTSFTLPSTLPALTVSEDGSSLLAPLFNLWVPNFTVMYSGVKINTGAHGSGAGQSGAETGTLQLGASDAYLTNATQAKFPQILNIPLAISAQQVNYNVPQIPASMHLNFSGNVLSGMYNGSISYWDDAAIKAINPGAASLLPHQTIIPIHRQDGSGDTFIFTSYLSASDQWWSKNIGFGTTVNWPQLPSATTGTGNGGMVSKLQSTNYSIAYIGVSFLSQTISDNLGYAFLQNRAGNFVNITSANIQAAANALVSQTPADERISLIYAPGANSYPIINYEYVMVSKNQNVTGMALVLRTILSWSIQPSYGNSPYFLNQVHFIPLPPSVVQLSMNQINEITGP